MLYGLWSQTRSLGQMDSLFISIGFSGTLLNLISAFLVKSKVGGNTNSTFLALIPKEVNPAYFDIFSPISLCNASYKILAKLLANRMKPLLGAIISPLQGGFAKGRHLIDNMIQVQEALHSSYQRKEKGVLIKSDMKNAFDQVKLCFLYQVLKLFWLQCRVHWFD